VQAELPGTALLKEYHLSARNVKYNNGISSPDITLLYGSKDMKNAARVRVI